MIILARLSEPMIAQGIPESRDTAALFCGRSEASMYH
jgi:hypothetical protein